MSLVSLSEGKNWPEKYRGNSLPCISKYWAWSPRSAAVVRGLTGLKAPARCLVALLSHQQAPAGVSGHTCQ